MRKLGVEGRLPLSADSSSLKTLPPAVSSFAASCPMLGQSTQFSSWLCSVYLSTKDLEQEDVKKMVNLLAPFGTLKMSLPLMAYYIPLQNRIGY